jgi:hypothetical protein
VQTCLSFSVRTACVTSSFSNEGDPREPAHIHVKGGGRDAKWLTPDISVADSYGFKSGEIARILLTVRANRTLILKAWHEHLGDGRSI